MTGGNARRTRATRASALVFALSLGACEEQASRNQIRAVGSSTVYPFATAVAEQFVNKNPQFRSPIVESTGTGAGVKLFCSGVGAAYPDIVNASRRMKRSEYDSCARNGVTQIIELQVGLDGIAFGESSEGDKLALTARTIYMALADKPFGKAQTARLWSDVDPTLPAEAIKVYGPPSTSGTRDALAELILTRGCDTDPAMKALKKSDADAHKRVCATVREDGAYVDAGENDNLIVQKIEADPKAVGVFGFSFMEENRDRLIANTIDGVDATYATITDFSYPGARPLYIYVKRAHIAAIPGLRDYIVEFARAAAPDKYLKRRGMILAPDDVRARTIAIATALTPLVPGELK